MGMGDANMHAQEPVWIVFGTLLIASVLGGLYLLVRTEVLPPASATPGGTGTATQAGATTGGESTTTAGTPTGSGTTTDTAQESTNADRSEPSDFSTGDHDGATDTAQSSPPHRSTRELLEMLPEDERRILEPVLDSPGLTQVALRDRASFSKAKISQTVSELEERGLLYRERQGRTYRVYPADELQSTE